MIRDFILDALWLGLILTVVPLAVASITGLIVAFLQAITQIQEQTTVYVAKLAGVTIAILLLGTTIQERFLALMVRYAAVIVSGGDLSW